MILYLASRADSVDFKLEGCAAMKSASNDTGTCSISGMQFIVFAPLENTEAATAYVNGLINRYAKTVYQIGKVLILKH